MQACGNKKSRKAIILKAEKGVTGNYIWGQASIILNYPGPETTGTRVRLHNNLIIQQQFLDIYLSQCYHQQPHKPAHIQTYKSPASFQSDSD